MSPDGQNLHKVLKSIKLALFITLGLASGSRAQTLIRDSIVLEIEPRTSRSISQPFRVDSVLDLREVHDPSLLGIKGTKHLIFVPVDLEILTEAPPAELVQRALMTSRPGEGISLALAIRNLDISSRSCFPFRNRYTINARVTVTGRPSAPEPSVKGELVFDSSVKTAMFKNDLKKGYELAFQEWLTEVHQSLTDVARHMQIGSKEPPYNFRSASPDLPWLQLNAHGNFTLIKNGFLIDGLLHFVYPEARRVFTDSPRAIRFRHQDRFDSIEFGLMNLLMNYRVSHRILIQAKSHFFFGLNRWKDMKTFKHKLQDVLIGDLSLSQSFHYYPKHARTPIFGIGLLQGVHYIHSRGFRIEWGLLFNMGMRL